MRRKAGVRKNQPIVVSDPESDEESTPPSMRRRGNLSRVPFRSPQNSSALTLATDPEATESDPVDTALFRRPSIPAPVRSPGPTPPRRLQAFEPPAAPQLSPLDPVGSTPAGLAEAIEEEFQGKIPRVAGQKSPHVSLLGRILGWKR